MDFSPAAALRQAAMLTRANKPEMVMTPKH